MGREARGEGRWLAVESDRAKDPGEGCARGSDGADDADGDSRGGEESGEGSVHAVESDDDIDDAAGAARGIIISLLPCLLVPREEALA